MAGETHILNLKAVLDTTLVKQQLDLLRQQQQKATAGGAPAGGVGVSGLTQLNSTLQQLTLALRQLQQGLMARLTNGTNVNMPFIYGNRRTRHALTPQNVLQRIRYNRFAHGNLSRLFKYAADALHIDTRDIPLAAYMNWRNKRTLHRELFMSAGRTGGLMMSPDLVTAGVDYQFNSRFRNIRGPQFDRVTSNPAYVTRQMNLLNKTRGYKSIAGFAAAYALNPVADYAEATGNEGVAKTLGHGQRILGAAATGAMIGGAPGAVIGLAAGTLASAFSELTDRVKKLNGAMEEQTQRVQSAKQFDAALKQQYDSDIDQRRFKVGDASYFLKKIAERQEAIEFMKKQNARVGEGPGALTGYEKETLQMIDTFRIASPSGTLPESIRRRQEIADTYKRNVANIERYQNDITGYRGSLNALGVYTDEQKDAQGFDSALKRKSYDLLVAMRDIWQGDWDSAEARKKRLLAESEETGIPAKLSVLENIQKEIDEYESKVRKTSAEIDIRAERRNTQEQLQKEDRLNYLQEALNNLKAPDMSSATSIAAMGFGMGEKDDSERVNMMEQHLREQSRLQKQIKDLIADGVDAQITF